LSGAAEPLSLPEPPPALATLEFATLEFAMAPADLPRLARLPGVSRAGGSKAVNVVWHDTAAGELGGRLLCLAHGGATWRLERLAPGAGADWPASSPPPLLGEATSPALLEPPVPFDTAPVAAFQGRRHSYRTEAGQLGVLCGTLRGVVEERPACRLSLVGPAAGLTGLALSLAVPLRLSVPRGGLAAEAAAVAHCGAPAPRHLGAPQVPPDQSVSDSLAQIVAHLLDVLLHWADRCSPDGPTEPVHQARVASRRLRSALSIFKHVAACPELAALAPALKDCAARLGAARDWDVFLEGTGAQLAASLPDDARCTAMLRAGRRRRAQAYAELRAFLGSPAFRQLELGLACAASLRPWDGTAEAAGLQQETGVFAAGVLARRLKRVRHAARGLAGLPTPALHELRKDCKRLRYAAEFFVNGFPHQGAKHFLRRLSALQEALGQLNDAAATSGLMAQLGRAGRGYAAGVVEGFSAASAGSAREGIGRAWKRFRVAEPFWPA